MNENIHSYSSVCQKSDTASQSKHNLGCTPKFRPAGFSFLKPQTHDITYVDNHLVLSSPNYLISSIVNHNLVFEAMS